MTKNARRYSAPAVACATDVLAMLSGPEAPVALAGLDRSLDHSKSLIYRTLKELERADFVSRDAQSRYRIGLRAFEVGVSYVTNSPLESAIRGALQELAQRSGEATNLGVLRGDEVLYLMKFEGGSSFVTISRVGGRVPAPCVANGKALLAALPDGAVRDVVSEPLKAMTPHSHRSLDSLERDLREIRERGYARDDNEAVPGRAGLAMTIPYPADPSRLAAISLSTEAAALDTDRGASLLELLTETCRRIEREVSTRELLPD